MSKKSAEKEYTFKRQIWFPKNYEVKKTDSSFELERQVEYKSSTYFPFWRWANFLLRTCTKTSDLFYYFGVVVPFASELSYRALFSPYTFYPNVKINAETGKIERDPKSRKLTFLSRIRYIWYSVLLSRAKFERTPDKGFIPKSVQRVFNLTWNFVFKGVLGTAATILVFPPLALAASTASLAFALSIPLWLPPLSAIGHFLSLIVYDMDYPHNSSFFSGFFSIPRVLLRLSVKGTVQPTIALAAAAVCPVLSVGVAALGLSRRVTRQTWDSLMYHSILKRSARIPSKDSFVAKRVAGPGLASNYFFKLRAEQALAVLEASLDVKILEAFVEFIEAKLNEPLEKYSKFFDTFFEKFSYGLNKKGVYAKLSEETDNHLSKYKKKADKRLKALRKSISNSELDKFRFTESDLNLTIYEASKMVKNAYENSILKYKKKSTEEFFSDRYLENNDWLEIVKSELEECINAQIMTPLEKTDEYFNLEVNHMDLEKYVNMIAKSDFKDDLDLVYNNYNPESGFLRFQAPSITDEHASLTSYLNYAYSTDCYTAQNFIGEFGHNMRVQTEIPTDAFLVAAMVYNNEPSRREQIDLEPPYKFEYLTYKYSVDTS